MLNFKIRLLLKDSNRFEIRFQDYYRSKTQVSSHAVPMFELVLLYFFFQRQ